MPSPSIRESFYQGLQVELGYLRKINLSRISNRRLKELVNPTRVSIHPGSLPLPQRNVNSDTNICERVDILWK